jgi:hypothetical protein
MLLKSLADFDRIFNLRVQEADAFYTEVQQSCKMKNIRKLKAGLRRHDLVQTIYDYNVEG